MISNVFGWKNVISISGADGYSAAGAAAFESSALAAGVAVTRSLQVNEEPSYTSLTAAVSAIASSNTRIVFLIAQATTSGLILREAYSQGVLGADSGYDGVTS